MLTRLESFGDSVDAGVGVFLAGGLNSMPCARRPPPELAELCLLFLLPRELAEPTGEGDLLRNRPSSDGLAGTTISGA
jgi:hypothetical protein